MLIGISKYSMLFLPYSCPLVHWEFSPGSYNSMTSQKCSSWGKIFWDIDCTSGEPDARSKAVVFLCVYVPTPLQIKLECQERAQDSEGDSPFLRCAIQLLQSSPQATAWFETKSECGDRKPWEVALLFSDSWLRFTPRFQSSPLFICRSFLLTS